jgi:DNA polymerase-4
MMLRHQKNRSGTTFCVFALTFRDVQKKSDAVKAMDTVNDRFGEFKVTFGSLLSAEEKGSHVISPAWRTEGIRNVAVK